MFFGKTSTVPSAAPDTLTCVGQQNMPPSLPASEFVDLKLSTPGGFDVAYSSLRFDLYNLRSDSRPSNVLAFVQNAAKRELADLVSAILPGLQHHYARYAVNTDHIFNLTDLQGWWKTFMRFMFFVAEIEDDIVRKTTEQYAKLSRRLGEFKRITGMQRLRKSLEDKYSFTMEVVFRAADVALEMYIADPDSESLRKASLKFKAVTQFMLDTMTLSKSLISEAEGFSDLQINNLERNVAWNLFSFAQSESPALVCVYTRWLEDEKHIMQWIHNHCGVRGKLFGEKWARSYAEGRGRFVSEMHAIGEFS